MQKIVKTLAIVALGMASLGSAGAQALRVGVSPGPLADSAHVAAQEAQAKGLQVQVVEFTDWTLPNTALVSKDLDLNYYQHQAFLETYNQQNHQDLRSIGVGLRGSIGLFSRKYKSLQEVPTGASVALANDTANQARALETLQAAGLLQLRAGAPRLAQLSDVASNPRKLKFIELDGTQIPRAIDDAGLVVVSMGLLVQSGMADIARNGLYYSQDGDGYWAIQFVTRPDNQNDPRIRQFMAIYQQSLAVRQRLHEAYAKESRFYSLPWLAKP